MCRICNTYACFLTLYFFMHTKRKHGQNTHTHTRIHIHPQVFIRFLSPKRFIHVDCSVDLTPYAYFTVNVVYSRISLSSSSSSEVYAERTRFISKAFIKQTIESVGPEFQNWKCVHKSHSPGCNPT